MTILFHKAFSNCYQLLFLTLNLHLLTNQKKVAGDHGVKIVYPIWSTDPFSGQQLTPQKWTLDLISSPSRRSSRSFARDQNEEVGRFMLQENLGLVNQFRPIAQQGLLDLYPHSVYRYGSAGVNPCQHMSGFTPNGDVAAFTRCPDGRTTGVFVSNGNLYVLYPVEESQENRFDSSEASTSAFTRLMDDNGKNEQKINPPKDGAKKVTLGGKPHLLKIQGEGDGKPKEVCGMKAAAKISKNATMKIRGGFSPISSLYDVKVNEGTFRDDEKYTLELAVFTDPEFLTYIESRYDGDPLPHLVDVVLAFVNGVEALFNYQHIKPALGINVVQLDVLSTDGPKEDDDILNYLNNFCPWAAQRNPIGRKRGLWDHAILISGKDLSIGGDKSVMGLAYVDGICTVDESCSVNEGRSFESVFVIAHELAHNFGLGHDGDKGAEECGDGDHIMSESVGPGKTTWSECSKTAFQAAIRKAKCLRDTGTQASEDPPGMSLENDITSNAIDNDEPKKQKRFSADEQCAFDNGKGFSSVPDQEDICYDLYCTNGAKIVRTHPAVEGTECGSEKYCSLGVCSSTATPDTPDNGDHSSKYSFLGGSWWNNIENLFKGKTNKVKNGPPKIESNEVGNDFARSIPTNDPNEVLQNQRVKDEITNDLIMPLSSVEWKVVPGECSASCGGGRRKVETFCVLTGSEEQDMPKVDPELCSRSLSSSGSKKETHYEDCNTQACPRGQWEARDWGRCFPASNSGENETVSGRASMKSSISGHCGEEGIQYRAVICKAHLLRSLRAAAAFQPAQGSRTFSEIWKRKLLSKLNFVLKDSECPLNKPIDRRYCVVTCGHDEENGGNDNSISSTVSHVLENIVNFLLPT